MSDIFSECKNAILAFKKDVHRYGGFNLLHHFRFLLWFRISQYSSNRLILLLCKFRLKRFSEKYGLEIQPGTNIGYGLYIGHPFNITINPSAILGRNINIHKGVTIGEEKRGNRKGTPIIGDEVWIGVNATIVGSVTIGNNVLIAPNSFVNCDVPSNSVVFGNPCIIKSNNHATHLYINRKV